MKERKQAVRNEWIKKKKDTKNVQKKERTMDDLNFDLIV